MIINHDPYYEKRREAQKKLEDGEVVRKERMLDELRKESVGVICLAAMYAKGFEETGENITKAWQTAEQQMEIIQCNFNKGYKAGYIDGIVKGKEIERQERAERAELDRQYVRKGSTKKRHKR